MDTNDQTQFTAFAAEGFAKDLNATSASVFSTTHDIIEVMGDLASEMTDAFEHGSDTKSMLALFRALNRMRIICNCLEADSKAIADLQSRFERKTHIEPQDFREPDLLEV